MKSLLWFLCFTSVSSFHLLLENIDNCPNIKIMSKFHFTLTTPNQKKEQILSYNVTAPFDIGLNTEVKYVIDLEDNSKNWKHLFTFIDHEGLCHFLNMYLGELWYDMQRHMGLLPKTCPIPKGSYTMSNYKLDWEKLKLQTFPVGRLRMYIYTIEKQTENVIGCLRINVKM